MPAAVQVVLPFYRSGDFLREAIESVLCQREFEDWHLTLVNDASDDLDVSIAQEYRAAFPHKITLLQHQDKTPRGTSAARNLAIRDSESELVAFLDADDTWYSTKLRLQVDLLNQFQNVDMVYGPALRWYSWNGGQDLHVAVSVDNFGCDCTVPGAALLASFLRDESLTPCTGSVLLRRSAILRAGGFEEQFRGLYDDQVFYAKICSASNVYVSSACVSRYRQHPDSCCYQADSANTSHSFRRQFLHWLRDYRAAQNLGNSELALSPRELLAT